MAAPTPQEIRARLEERRRRDQERIRQEEEAMDAFAVQAVRVLTQTFQDGAVEEDEPETLGSSDEPTTIHATTARAAHTRRAIDARRDYGASPSPKPQQGEPSLRAALRGIVTDYAEPITPSEETLSEVEAFRGIALDDADTDGLWAELELGQILGVRAGMDHAVEVVTSRIESTIIDELVAARLHLAAEYPDVPLVDAPEPATAEP